MNARIEHAVTSGTFSLDGQTHDVDNNAWVVGGENECVVIDAPHDAGAIQTLVGGRAVKAILLTHGHDDHIRVVGELQEATLAPIYLHPADRMLWDMVFPDRAPDEELADGQTFNVGGSDLLTVHTPGHSPGAVCFYAQSLGTVFTGDTMFAGGPGATGRSYSDFPTIIDSISDKLLTLPADTVVRPGHGDTTTIGSEAPHLQDWIDRGY